MQFSLRCLEKIISTSHYSHPHQPVDRSPFRARKSRNSSSTLLCLRVFSYVLYIVRFWYLLLMTVAIPHHSILGFELRFQRILNTRLFFRLAGRLGVNEYSQMPLPSEDLASGKALLSCRLRSPSATDVEDFFVEAFSKCLVEGS